MSLKISSFVLALCLPLNALATTTTEVWAKGVSREKGWVDFNKKESTRDFGYCWAAAGANILAWWQAQYQVPAETPTGESVWETFREAFASDYGSLPRYAIEWWLTGNYEGTGKDRFAQLMPNVTAGGYYKDYFGNERQLSSYLLESNNPSYAAMSESIVNYLKGGYGITLSLRPQGQSGGHEITLWGVTCDENGLITSMFVTDSDDKINHNEEQSGLFEVTCYALKGGGNVTFLGLDESEFGEDIYVANFDALGPADFLIAIPEPSAFGLLAGLGALALVVSRRKNTRKR